MALIKDMLAAGQFRLSRISKTDSADDFSHRLMHMTEVANSMGIAELITRRKSEGRERRRSGAGWRRVG